MGAEGLEEPGLGIGGGQVDAAGDQQFLHDLAVSGDVVASLDIFDGRPREGGADLRRVVNRHQDLALGSIEGRGQAREILAAEQARAIVVLAAPVGRIDVEQRPRPGVSRDEVRPVQMLDDR